MFPLLAIESSSQTLSAAVFFNETQYDQLVSPVDGNAFSSKILRVIDELLKKNKLKAADIHSFGVAIGPGSFTSLRVGIATVLGLAKVGQKTVYGVSSLQSMALKANEGFIAPFLKAGRGQIYGALYRADSLESPIILESCFEPEEFVAKVLTKSNKARFVGPAESDLLPTVQVEPLFGEAVYVGRLVIRSPYVLQKQDLLVNYLKEADLGS